MKIAELLLGEKCEKIHPDWLKNPETNYNLEIDGFFKKSKVAIEYHGRQHFMPVKFGGISQDRANKNFKKQQELDRLKLDLIKQNNDKVRYFVVITCNDNITEDLVKEKLIKAGALKKRGSLK